MTVSSHRQSSTFVEDAHPRTSNGKFSHKLHGEVDTGHLQTTCGPAFTIPDPWSPAVDRAPNLQPPTVRTARADEMVDSGADPSFDCDDGLLDEPDEYLTDRAQDGYERYFLGWD